MANQRYRNIYLDNHSHFCTASTVAFIPVLANDQVRRLILNSWQKQRARYNVMIEGFVIMPEHIHILIRGRGDDVRRFMQYSLAQTSIDIRQAVQRRARSGDAKAAQWLSVIAARANGAASGKVWKERFRCFPMDKEEAALDKLRYMHLNPVERGLVSQAGDWAWSSQSHYEGLGCVIPVDTALSCGN